LTLKSARFATLAFDNPSTRSLALNRERKKKSERLRQIKYFKLNRGTRVERRERARENERTYMRERERERKRERARARDE
jgi:hypothetical protein